MHTQARGATKAAVAGARYIENKRAYATNKRKRDGNGSQAYETWVSLAARRPTEEGPTALRLTQVSHACYNEQPSPWPKQFLLI